MFKRILAALVVAIAYFGFFASANPAMAQTKTILIGSGTGGLLESFETPEEPQPVIWLWNDTAEQIEFYHPGGTGPFVTWPMPGQKVQSMSKSSDGTYAIVKTETHVDVLTLKLKKQGRLAGVTTPRTVRRIPKEGVADVSIARNELWILSVAGILTIEQLRPTIYLPMLHVARQEGPNWARETPVVVDPGSCPRIIRCYGLSSDPPECAERTPEPGELPPTPERGGPVVPTRTPEPVQTEEPIETPIVIP